MKFYENYGLRMWHHSIGIFFLMNFVLFCKKPVLLTKEKLSLTTPLPISPTSEGDLSLHQKTLEIISLYEERVTMLSLMLAPPSEDILSPLILPPPKTGCKQWAKYTLLLSFVCFF